MKRLLSFLLVAWGVFGAFSISYAAEVIHRFNVKATLSTDRLLRVTEYIEYDFGDEERHGIFRIIPVIYDREGKDYNLKLNVTEVLMDGAPVTHEVSREGAGLQIKIGDADKTITGSHQYAITYETRRAINDFSDHKELYWNVTGNEWIVPIEQATFELFAPGRPTQVACYTGMFGSTAQKCTSQARAEGAIFQSTVTLDVGEGLTAIAGFPVDMIDPPTAAERAWELFAKYVWYVLPLVVLLFMFGLWWMKGKDPKGRGTIIAHYEEPRGMPPAMISAMIAERVPERAITATILDLARQGYLKVKFFGDHANPDKKTDAKTPIIFTKLKSADERLLPYEKILMEGLFKRGDETNTEMLSGTFWKTVAEMRASVQEELKKRGWVMTNPSSIRAAWMVLAVGLAIIGALLAMAEMISGMASLFICAVLVAVFGWFMPRITKAGAEVREECLGFREFLSVTEKDRLHFHDAPEKRPEQFGRFLPAAMALGVEEKWAKQFEDMKMQMPDYMQGGSGITTPLAFAHVVEAMNDAAARSVYASPGASRSTSGGSGYSGFSGGGGSSGGGFGGGGGGSW